MKAATTKPGTKLGVLALLMAVGCTVLWFYQARQVDIPDDRTVFVVVFLSAAALGIAAFVKGTGWVGGVAAVIAILIGSFLPFTVAISRQEVAASAIQVGDTMPRFAALDDRGERFDSSRLKGQTVLIKFFRGHW